MSENSAEQMKCPTCGAAKSETAWRPDNRIPIALMAIMAVLTMVTFVRVVQTRSPEPATLTHISDERLTTPGQ